MSNQKKSVSRREFTKQLTTGTAAFAAASSLSNESQADENSKKEKGMPQKSSTDKKPPRRPPSQADMILATIMQRYPSEHFTEEILRIIHRAIRGDIIRGAFLSRFPLKNSDEPGFVFSAYRSDAE